MIGLDTKPLHNIADLEQTAEARYPTNILTIPM
jgi:hypothetical protein